MRPTRRQSEFSERLRKLRQRFEMRVKCHPFLRKQIRQRLQRRSIRNLRRLRHDSSKRRMELRKIPSKYEILAIIY